MEAVEMGEPVKFKAIITVRPDVKLGEYKGLAVTRRTLEIGDEEVAAELENQRNRMSKLVDLPAE